MTDHDDLIAKFIDLTQTSSTDARGLLEASNWSLEEALELHYAVGDGNANIQQDDEMDEDKNDEDDRTFQPPSSLPTSSLPATGGRTLGGASSESAAVPQESSSTNKTRRTGGMMTLDQLKGSSGGGGPSMDSDDDEGESQDMFAGGEKSGLAIENPGKKGARDDLVKNILKKAEAGTKARQENPEVEEDAGPSKPRFGGTGQTLGSDDVPSQVIPDPNAAVPQKLQKAVRNLYFWKDGFSIEDGPLMRYDDPAHRANLEAIQQGRAPLHLMNVEPGQPTDVHVFRKMEEEYKPPPKKVVPFGGSGQRLGAPTPEVASSSSSSSAPISQPVAPQNLDIDSTQPTTSIQIRLGDGTRLVSKFNHTHTIQDLYAFVNASNTQSRTRGYVLQTTFPNKELKDMNKTIKEEGLINAVVVQKWN